MSTSCSSSLSNHILNNICTESYGKGVTGTAYIFAYDNIDFGDTVIDGVVVEEIALVTGAKGYRLNMAGTTPFTGLTLTDQNAALGAAFTKTAPVTLLADSPQNALNVLALKGGKHVVVLENNKRGAAGEQAFFVIGLENGCTGQDFTMDKYSDDSLGGWSGNLVETDASKPQVFVFDTDYATTKAMLEALIATE